MKKRRRIWRWVLALVVLAIALATASGWRAYGHRATGERRARMEKSPEWHDGKFVNPQPLVNYYKEGCSRAMHASDNGSPSQPLPVQHPILNPPPSSGLRVAWLGHSSTILEIDGKRILTDPLWGERSSPMSWIGPVRWYAPPLPLADLPPIDAVLISHDHYDHLDYSTIVALRDRVAKFIVPLGIGAHLSYWGIPDDKIVELDWWQEFSLGDLKIASVPARHAAGRTVYDQDAKLWSGYAIVGNKHRVYYSGDTGIFPAMRDIGKKFGPFDLTMIEVGQYDPSWPDWHSGPENAVRAHQLVDGRVMLPIHWGLLRLAYHGWTEPIERALAAAREANVTILAPRPGESVEPEMHPPVERWWPTLPWKSAKEDPIVSTQMN